MSDVSELIARLRFQPQRQINMRQITREPGVEYVGDVPSIYCAAADALEAQGREIADLQAGWQRTYDHDVARLQERLAAAERELSEVKAAGYAGELAKRLAEAERDRDWNATQWMKWNVTQWMKCNATRTEYMAKLAAAERERDEAEALLQEVYDGRQSLMSVGLVYRIGHTLNHRPADSATHREDKA